MNHPSTRFHAFTLVEVVLALGIISFALVSIMGVTLVGFKGFQEAISTNVETQIAQTLANQLQQTSYTNLLASGNSNYYFDYEGGATNAAGAAFTVAMTSPKDVALPDTQSAGSSTNLRLVTFRITRKNSPLTTNVFQVFIANTGF